MLRSQSVDRLSYQNIASRIQRIRATANGHSNSQTRNMSSSNLSYNREPITSFQSKTNSSYRGAYKLKENFSFGNAFSLENCEKEKDKDIGKLQRNVGIKKYNQAQIKEILARNSVKNQNSQNYKRIEDINCRAEALETTLSPRFSYPENQESRKSVKASNFKVPSHSTSYVSPFQKDPSVSLQPSPADHSRKYEKSAYGGLEAGKIYSFQKLSGCY